AEAGEGPERAAGAGEDAQVEVAGVQQRVLQVRAGDVVHRAERTRRDALAGLPAERVEADVVADRGHDRGSGGEADELGRFGRGHRQRLFADHVFAGGEGAAGVVEVVAVRRGDVDDLHVRVGEE